MRHFRKKLSKGDIILFEKIKIIRKRKIPQIFNRRYDQSNIIRIIEGFHFNRIENISDVEKKLLKYLMIVIEWQLGYVKIKLNFIKRRDREYSS